MKPSSILRFILKTIAIIASIMIGIIGYIFIRPIFRAAGWVISIASLILLLDWLL